MFMFLTGVLAGLVAAFIGGIYLWMRGTISRGF